VAIQATLSHAGPEDIILIAGKGHEEYQEIKGERFYFSDVKEVLATGG
jgi:UDP-N-acetylmuramoyl-L-alanyl-D-glutamate--2,6-diaminopimelate ligase